jgi:hypothetical protein
MNVKKIRNDDRVIPSHFQLPFVRTEFASLVDYFAMTFAELVGLERIDCVMFEKLCDHFVAFLELLCLEVRVDMIEVIIYNDLLFFYQL